MPRTVNWASLMPLFIRGVKMRQDLFEIFTMSKKHTEVSKFLSYVLRHQPESIGLTLDSEGWADINSLIACASKENQRLDQQIIQAVVESSDKKRFAISEDGLCIRAVQGHSTQQVDISFKEKMPPELLYHGTATRFLEAIKDPSQLAGIFQFICLYICFNHSSDEDHSLG
ncbi:RNA 2'-phosphotransferase [Yersinia kristensenii]|uniref:RNA 2'-phosphotransferase n=1 Tax=Yersinia kristensenii TaxID=28152 RepID=UPI00358DC9DA